MAVQQLLDAAAAAGGGIVQLEPRVYQTCKTLLVGSNTHLRGAGRGATIIRGSANIIGAFVDNAYVGSSIGAVNATNVTISDLTIDHVTCNRNANGVSLLPRGLPGDDSQAYNGAPSTNGLIERLEVLGSPAFHNYMIWNLKGRHIKIVNNWVDGGSSQPSAQEGIESFGGHDVLISGNTVKNIGSACINVGSAGLQESGTVAVTMVNNYLSNCEIGVNLGTALSGADGQPQLHTRVVGNVIIGARQYGVSVAVFPGTLEGDLTISHNTIRDISASGAVGVFLHAANGPLGSDAVVSNTISENHIENIRGSNSHGIRVTYYPNVRIFGNTITGTDDGGIYVVFSNDLEITGNRVEQAGVLPIQLWGASGWTVDRFVVERNLIRNWSGTFAGVLVVWAKQGTVRDNVFHRSDLTKPSPVVVASSCGVTVTGNIPWYDPAWQGSSSPACP